MNILPRTSHFKHRKLNIGFTLVELLVVISIIGILATIGLVAFTSAQQRGHDAQRKSDLKELSKALELFYSDYGHYPNSSAGEIVGCPSTSAIACSWGTDEFRDVDGSGNTKTTYFKVLPKDPSSGSNYYYRIADNADNTNQKFQIFASLENLQDLNCLPGTLGEPSCSGPANIPGDVNCGSGKICNFAVTSSNTTPIEQ